MNDQTTAEIDADFDEDVIDSDLPEAVNQHLTRVRKRNNSLARRIASLEARVRDQAERLRFVDESGFRKRMVKIDKALLAMSQRIIGEITRSCVLTETMRVYPELTNNLIDLMDLPYEFFYKYRGLYLQDWAELARSRDPVGLATKFEINFNGDRVDKVG